MLVGRPLPLFSSWVSSGVFWVLGLFTRTLNVGWVWGVGCALCTVLAAAVRITMFILFLFMSSRNAWKVLQHLFCHALCALPQFTQDTLSFRQSFVGWLPAHSPHLSCFPQAVCVCPHPWHLYHCFISSLCL